MVSKANAVRKIPGLSQNLRAGLILAALAFAA
jgi:hypothetical protein